MRRHRHPAFPCAMALVPLLTLAGCLRVLTGDEAFADEFAQYKAAGGQCQATAQVRDVDTELSGVGQYRWLSMAGALGDLVSPEGLCYYDLLIADPELTRATLTTVEDLAAVDPANFSSRAEKQAFWINAYNTLVLVGAADGYAADPAFRVDDNDFGFFERIEHQIGPRLYSLNQIEHGVLRGDEFHPSVYFLDDDEKEALLAVHADLWGDGPIDPRFHFALNCASSSCPPLFPFALRGDTLDVALDDVTRAFLSDPVRGAGPDGISQIFSFYYNDFVNDAGSIEAFIARYRDLDEVNTQTFLDYDWALNRAPPP